MARHRARERWPRVRHFRVRKPGECTRGQPGGRTGARPGARRRSALSAGSACVRGARAQPPAAGLATVVSGKESSCFCRACPRGEAEGGPAAGPGVPGSPVPPGPRALAADAGRPRGAGPGQPAASQQGTLRSIARKHFLRTCPTAGRRRRYKELICFFLKALGF